MHSDDQSAIDRMFVNETLFKATIVVSADRVESGLVCVHSCSSYCMSQPLIYSIRRCCYKRCTCGKEQLVDDGMEGGHTGPGNSVDTIFRLGLNGEQKEKRGREVSPCLRGSDCHSSGNLDPTCADNRERPAICPAVTSAGNIQGL